MKLFAARRYADGERLARDMTVAYPDDVFGWKALGAMMMQSGRTADALEPMQKAADLEPRDAEARTNLGSAFASLERFEEAVATFRTAIELKPAYPEPYNGMGSALRALGRLSEAEDAYRRSIALRPGYPEAHCNLGNALLDQGRPGEAEEAYRTAIAGNPKLAECYRNLGMLAKYAENDPRIPRMEQMYRERQLPESDHLHLCFALGKACEDLGRVDDAFAYYAEGNRLRKRQLGYTPDQDRQLFAAIRAAFSQAASTPPSAAPTDTQAEPRPIFIVGMLRSGTTLAEQILASHSQVFGAGELEAMNHALQRELNQDTPGYRFNRDADAIARIRRHYREVLTQLSPGTPVITDKMPTNFRWIGFMLEAFPEARVVNLVRDPVAVCWSIYKRYFPSTGIGFAYDLADLGGYYGLYRELMTFWRERFPGRIHDLNYERLTENQEQETRALLEFCDLPWEEGCLDFHKTERDIRTASALQVRKKLYRGSSEAWKAYEKHLGPLIDALNPPSTAPDEAILLIQAFEQGRLEEAQHLAHRMTQTQPTYAIGWKILGLTLAKRGETGAALQALTKAAALAPDDAGVHSGLGNLFRELGRWQEAEAACRQAIRLQPDFAEPYNILGYLLWKSGKFEEAEAACRKDIELRPDSSEPHHNLGILLRDLGRFQEAETAYREAIALKPDCAPWLLSLSTVASFAKDDPCLPLMERLYQDAALPEEERTLICFALGKAYEDLQRYDDAFRLYREGNRLRKKALAYTLDQDRALFEAMQVLFSGSAPHEAIHAPDGSTPRPIFIVGMPRSGTSLVEQILASHSQVFGAGESMAMGSAVRAQFMPDGKAFHFTISKDAIEGIRARYLTALRQSCGDAPIVTDKTPTNVLWLGFILEAFPEAKVVNLIRDPVAVCWSNYKHYFSDHALGFAYDLDDLAGYFRMYQALMAFWRQRYPGRIHDVSYEALTENQEERTRALLEYCGLPWEENCLDFHETERAVHSASTVQVRKKLYQGSSEAWRKFEKHLGPLVAALKEA